MPKYIVYLVATASTAVEVEADSGDAAVDIALEGSLPFAPAAAGFDLGDWTTSSEVFGTKPEDDYDLSSQG